MGEREREGGWRARDIGGKREREREREREEKRREEKRREEKRREEKRRKRNDRRYCMWINPFLVGKSYSGVTNSFIVTHSYMTHMSAKDSVSSFHIPKWHHTFTPTTSLAQFILNFPFQFSRLHSAVRTDLLPAPESESVPFSDLRTVPARCRAVSG